MDSIRREEAVIDALAQTVLVDRVSEIRVGIPIIGPEGCGCHAKLHSRIEIIENTSPGAIVSGASTVTLIDDYEVEEVGR